MQKKILHTSLLLLMVSFLMVACKKGDTGSQGPAGPAGPPGAAGPKGDKGNANVITDTFTIRTADWKYNSIYWVGTSPNVSQGQVSKYFDRANDKITDSILGLGAVLVYYTNPSALQGQWTPLPISWLDNFTGNYTYNYAFVASKGKIQLHFFFAKVAGNTTPAIATFNVPTIRVKVVLISSALGLTADMIARIKTLPYEEVQKMYNLSE
ncbi:MAG: hypothetical protein ABW036_09505, partial [Flavitalea sp.]